ncbi:hypothetical protein ABIB50_003918 [Mucilaginibacter sp. UYCu711]
MEEDNYKSQRRNHNGIPSQSIKLNTYYLVVSILLFTFMSIKEEVIKSSDLLRLIKRMDRSKTGRHIILRHPNREENQIFRVMVQKKLGPD